MTTWRASGRQVHKLKSICPREIEDYDQRYRAILHQRLEECGAVQTGAALCLGARQGSKVKAFIDKGCFAVGVDLNPGRDKRYVLPCDFHALQFADQSVDIVFFNSFDHAFDLTKLLREVTRVLRPGGAVGVGGRRRHGEAGFSRFLRVPAIVHRGPAHRHFGWLRLQSAMPA